MNVNDDIYKYIDALHNFIRPIRSSASLSWTQSTTNNFNKLDRNRAVVNVANALCLALAMEGIDATFNPECIRVASNIHIAVPMGSMAVRIEFGLQRLYAEELLLSPQYGVVVYHIDGNGRSLYRANGWEYHTVQYSATLIHVVKAAMEWVTTRLQCLHCHYADKDIEWCGLGNSIYTPNCSKYLKSDDHPRSTPSIRDVYLDFDHPCLEPPRLNTPDVKWGSEKITLSRIPPRSSLYNT